MKLLFAEQETTDVDALELSLLWLDNVLQRVSDAVIATDTNGTVLSLNAAAEELTGFRRQDAEARDVCDILKLRAAEEVASLRAIAEATTQRLPAGAQLVRPDGTEREVEGSIFPITSAASRRLGSVVVLREVTETRRLEARVALAERLASISTVAAGMAHEVNNPLAAALGNVDFATEILLDLHEDLARVASAPAVFQQLNEALEALEDARVAGARVRHIVNDLKTFARSSDSAITPLDLPAVVEASIGLTKHLVHHDVTLTTKFRGTPRVRANEGKLVQVFSNLIANALQAVQANSGPKLVEVLGWTDATGRGVVDISDNGGGIKPEHVARVFDPFFTTKPSGVGLGLGLAVCRELVASQAGEISVAETSAQGTTFRVALPALRSEAPLRRKTVPPANWRRCKVLLVEDEQLVTRSLQRLLGRVHEIHPVEHPEGALDRLEKGQAFDVILCDLTTAGASGVQFLESLQELFPDHASRVVLLFGGTLTQPLAQFFATTPDRILHKPFESEELLRAIDRCAASG